jgi:hypothetical protein
MEKLAQQRQESYEKRRRARILGMAIDQTIQGLKNIVTYSDYKFWEVDDQGLIEVQKWKAIRDHAEASLISVIDLEKKLITMAPIYASMIPSNKELEMYRENPNLDSKSKD